MAVSDILIKIDGITGETKQKGMEGYMELQSFGIGAANNSTFGTGTGGGNGKSTTFDLTCSKYKDKGSIHIFNYCLTGQHIKEVVVEARKAAGTDKLGWNVLLLQNCFITSYNESGMPDGSIMESFTINYAMVAESYIPQGDSGSAEDGPIDFEYHVNQGV